VRTVEGLRVVDASIIPDIPSVPTNVTTIMVAERIAARLCDEQATAVGESPSDENAFV